MRTEIHIRSATFDDLADVARIHVQSWKETYAGQLPQDYLDKMDTTGRQKRWEELFRGNAAEDNNLYLAFDDKKPIGFISFGRARDQTMINSGEIYAVYLLRDVWGKGAGYGLFKMARQKLAENGFDKFYLWVLDTNQNAINAYRRWGGTVENDIIKHHVIANMPVKEIAITFGSSTTAI